MFDGRSDPEAYLTWELKVGKIFRMHNYSEERRWQWRRLNLMTML
jgi:hypothetical protein